MYLFARSAGLVRRTLFDFDKRNLHNTTIYSVTFYSRHNSENLC